MLSKHKTFYVFHILIGCCGTLLIAFGTSYAIAAKNGVAFFDNSVLEMMAIICGAIQLVACVLGSVGVFHEKVLLVLISNILHLAAGVNVAPAIIGLMTVYSNDFSKNVTMLVHNNGDLPSLEQNFKCCGFDGPTNYYNGTVGSYPPSCCGGVYPCIQPFDNGCVSSILDILCMYFKVIGYVSSISLIVGIIFVAYFGAIKCLPWPVGLDGRIVKKQKEDTHIQDDRKESGKLKSKLRELLKKNFIMFEG